MNETPKQHLAPGQQVLVIGHDKKPHRAKITEVIGHLGARLESLDGKNSSISHYSETGEVNTFRFADASAETESNQEAKKK